MQSRPYFEVREPEASASCKNLQVLSPQPEQSMALTCRHGITTIGQTTTQVGLRVSGAAYDERCIRHRAQDAVRRA